MKQSENEKKNEIYEEVEYSVMEKMKEEEEEIKDD